MDEKQRALFLLEIRSTLFLVTSAHDPKHAQDVSVIGQGSIRPPCEVSTALSHALSKVGVVGLVLLEALLLLILFHARFSQLRSILEHLLLLFLYLVLSGWITKLVRAHAHRYIIMLSFLLVCKNFHIEQLFCIVVHDSCGLACVNQVESGANESSFNELVVTEEHLLID